LCVCVYLSSRGALEDFESVFLSFDFACRRRHGQTRGIFEREKKKNTKNTKKNTKNFREEMPRYNPKKAAAKAANKKQSSSSFKKEKQQSTGLTKAFTKGTGVDFVKQKRKVGKKIKKSANNTNADAKITSKKVNILEQSVAANLSNDGTLRTQRGVGMQELVNRTTHHGGKTRKEALEGMLELLSEFRQEALSSRRNGGSVDANAVCEAVCARFVDADADVRKSAVECMRDGLLPAFQDENGISPFADSIILRCGAALTHVDARVREDAPKALKAVIDFAPRVVVTRRPPRETLSRFNAALLDSGEERAKKGSTGGNIDTKRDVEGKITSLECCAAFLMALEKESSPGSSTRERTFRENGGIRVNFRTEDEENEREYPRASVSSNRFYKNTNESTTFDANSETESSETRIAFRKLRANCLKVWQDCAETLRDEHGVDVVRVECMIRAMECIRLLTNGACLRDATTNDAFEVDFAAQIEKVLLVSRAFPASAPGGGGGSSGGASQKQTKGIKGDARNTNTTTGNDKIRASLAKHNVEVCKVLLAITKRRLVSDTYPGIGYSSRMWLASAITPPGVVLDGGEVGTKVETPEEWYADLLRVAKDALLAHHEGNMDVSFEHLRFAVAQVWNQAASGNTSATNTTNSKKKSGGITNAKEMAALKRKACVEIFSEMIDQRSAKKSQRKDSSSGGGGEASLEWISVASRALWTMKHKEPKTTLQLLNAARRLANTVMVESGSENDTALLLVMQKIESEIAPFFAICVQGQKPIPGPFTKLPREVQFEALALLGALPSISVITIKALAAAALLEPLDYTPSAEGDEEEEEEEENGKTLVGRVVDLASFRFKNNCELALTVSLLVTFLAGPSFTESPAEQTHARKLAAKTRKKICDAIIALGDDAFSGIRLASAAITKTIEKRIEDGDAHGAERCAKGGVLLIDRAMERSGIEVNDEFAKLRQKWAQAVR